LKDIKQRPSLHHKTLENGKLTRDDLIPPIHKLHEREKALQVTKRGLDALLSIHKMQLADEKPVKESLEDLHEMLNDSPFCATKGIHPFLFL
jgi:hypothetical protein